MYQPQLSDSSIHRIWVIAKAQRRPMTHVVAEAVERYLCDAEAAIGSAADNVEPAFGVTERGRAYLRRALKAA